jgi:hypothetical protein
MPKYPAQIDNSQSLPTAVDNLTPVQGAIFNKLRDAVLAVESELGVKPSASYTTVKARIDAIEGVVGNLRIIELDKDLGGTLENPLVIGIQGRPVSTVAPQFNEVLVWDGIAWVPRPQSGGGGGGFNPPPGTAPGQTLIWNGATYNPDFMLQDDVVPPLELTLTGPLQFVEVNQPLVTPAFTATYEETPSSAILTDSAFAVPKDVTSTPTSFNSDFTLTGITFGTTVTFTLTAIQGHVTKEATCDVIWGQKAYYGTGSPGQTGETFIKNLVGSIVTNDKNVAFSISASAGQKIYFACRAGYGDVVFTIHDIEGGFTKTQTVSITNDFGFTEDYDLYESDYAGLGDLLIFVGDGDDFFVSGGGPVGPPGPTGPAGAGGAAYLVFRPGDSDHGNVYSTWAGLMTARSAIDGPVNIAVDSSLSVARVDAGTWDFGGNTYVVGFFSGNASALAWNTGATILNAHDFKNIILNFPTVNTGGPYAIDFSIDIPFIRMDNVTANGSFGNAGAINFGGSFTPGFQLFGRTSFPADVFAWVFDIGSNTVTGEMYDVSFVQNDTIHGSAGSTVYVTVVDSFAGISASQSTITSLNIFQESAGGTLVGDVTGALGSNVVEQISGTGGNVNIACANQTSTANAKFQPFSAQAQFTATGAFEALYNSYTIPVNTGVQVDVIITAISSSGVDFASWKLSFGAQRVGAGSALTVGSNPSSFGVIPDRNTTGAAAWLATVILSGNIVQVKGQAVSGVIWGISFQSLPINP